MVKIDEVCEKTQNTHTVIEEMRRYLGSVQLVDFVSYMSVEIKGFAWHPDDLSIPEELVIKRKPELFNPENIC